MCLPNFVLLEIINSCLEAGLPEAKNSEQFGGILVEIFKNRFTPEQMKKADLNESQIKSVLFVAENGSISNREYQALNETSDRTALRDLEDLVSKQFLTKKGEKKSTRYFPFGG